MAKKDQIVKIIEGNSKGKDGARGNGVILHVWGRIAGSGVKSAPENATKEFRDACEKVGIVPTRRQFTKWNHKRGAAFLGRK